MVFAVRRVTFADMDGDGKADCVRLLDRLPGLFL
jgi:hypothetical protein